MRPQRSSSAVTRRASVRSGVTSAARVPVSAASRSSERDRQRLALLVGRLDPGEALGRRGEPRRQRAALGAPLVGDRRRPQRQRHQRVARRGRGLGRVPGRHAAEVEAERLGQPPEAVLRMVGRARLAAREPLPDRGRQPGVEPGQHDRPLRQPRDRGHEGAGRRPRAGGAGDDHRVRRRRRGPGFGQRVGGGAHPALHPGRAGRGGIVGDQRQEPQVALPVRGMLAGVDPGEGVERDPLALHLVEEVGEAVGEVPGGGLRRQLALGRGEAGDQPRELELAAQRRHRRRQAGAERVVGELGDDPDPRQQPRPGRGEGRDQRALRPAGVDPDLDARRRLGRLAGEAGVEPGDQRRGEVDPRRQAEDPRPRRTARTASPRQLRLGQRDPLGPADVDPAAPVHDAAQPALGAQPVPDAVEREDRLGKAVERRRCR